MVAGVIIVGVLVLVGAGLAMASVKDSAEERRVAAWKKLAERRGGRHFQRPESAGLFTPRDAVEVRCGRVLVRLDLRPSQSDNITQPETRARARFALGNGPRFTVTPAGFFAGFGRSMGLQDIPLGNPAFDSAFVVTGEDPSGIKTAWSSGPRATLRNSLPTAKVSSDGCEVTLITLGARADGLDDMVDLVGALASVGADGLDALAQLPDTTLTPAGGTWERPTPPTLKVTTAHGEATASVHPATGGPRVRLTLPLTRELPEFRVALGDPPFGQADGVPEGLITEYGARLLAELPGVHLESQERQLALRWPGIPEPAAFSAGVKLLSEVAGSAHRTGAFR
jgi:hypothetical protein